MHFPCNFGAVLQAYALSYQLKKDGVSVNIINYIPDYFKKRVGLWYVGNSKYEKNPLLRLAYYVHMVPTRYRRNRVFAQFRMNELNITKEYSQEDLMNGKYPSSEKFICGSDQIWNEINDTIYDPIYFLQFVREDCKRYSYAASGTISFPCSSKVEKIVIPRIKSFNQISVREDSLQQNLSGLINREIYHVCDPVFLLNQNEWKELTSKRQNTPILHKYVLVYVVGNDTKPFIKAREIGDKLNLPVYAISWFRCPHVDKILKCDPYEFVSVFSNAEYVITNSFHGTAFSIIFNKVFWVCDTYIANHRMKSILKRTELESRLITDGCIIDLTEKISWQNVNTHIAEFVNISKQYLKQIINS